jgi:hypothetical protein
MASQTPETECFLPLPVLAWAGWQADDDAIRTGGAIHPAPSLPMSLKRRITPVGRRVLEAGWAVLAGRDTLAPRIILSSRHGEYDRTVGLLHSLATDDAVSPAEFSLAVHHGLAGLLSIATGNKKGHTAIAAGPDTLGSALIEAAATLAEGGGTVLLLHFDDALPSDYDGIADQPSDPAAIALLLGAGGNQIRLGWRPAHSPPPPATNRPLLDLLCGTAGSVEIGGARTYWRLTRAGHS